MVRKEFGNLLDDAVVAEIKQKFKDKPTKPDDDINVSVDQTSNLTNAIAEGLSYPTLNENGLANYNQLMLFLEKLSDIFKWDKYESATLGQRSKATGQHGSCPVGAGKSSETTSILTCAPSEAVTTASVSATRKT